jgi:hypothetical protein
MNMDLVWYIITVVFWVFIAWLVAGIAVRKGYSFVLFFIFSLFFFLPALLVALLLPNHSKS